MRRSGTTATATAPRARRGATRSSQAASPGARTPDAWVVPDAGHTEEVYIDPAGYERRLVAFFGAALGEP